MDDRVRHLRILEEDVSVCNNCGLHELRTQTVFSRGSPQARLMFVGEAPGMNEDLEGKPFVGASGKLLDKMIEAMKLTENDVYICNAIKCRPPNNRTPTPEELFECKGYLNRQIQLIQPKVIVALGKSASYALADDVPIENLFPKGWAGKWREYMGVPVITTYHPAYLLREPHQKKVVGKHLKEVLKRLNA